MRYVARNRPFIVRQGADHFPARQNWNAKYLQEVMRDQTVNVAITPHGNADSIVRLPDGEGMLFVKPYETEMPFSTVLQHIQDNERRSKSTLSPTTTDNAKAETTPKAEEGESRKLVYYAQTQNDNLRSEYASLFSDIPSSIRFASIALDAEPEAINFWLGSSLSITAFHKDNYENIYVQILGQKHFVLLPPVEGVCVNERAVLGATYAPVGREQREKGQDGTGEDVELEVEELHLQIDTPQTYTPFPTHDPSLPSSSTSISHHHYNPTLFSSLSQPIKVTLEEGDMLYLPALWYHKVSQSCNDEGLCCAVNYWYDLDFGGGFWSTAGFVRGIGIMSLGDKGED
ncbi:Clavaminate synthase-like protein [Amniculicola lignicola CBS 123094]|uniref:Clavaminate synthase-like protein n=1 Tax=Amniculicola lignicola CBS 123094 TaxID=1392246 RepID=A0A6A5W391_9PLEO|nr:Clavaminate synthase-like protein [Amniculicola lignicola CBS 123094]